MIDLARRLEHLSRTHRTIAAAAADHGGVRDALVPALWAIGAAAHPPAMNELATALACDPSNATVLVRELESIGSVERARDPVDGRRRVVRLTADGRRIVELIAERLLAESPLRTLDAETLARIAVDLSAIDSQGHATDAG